VKSYKLRIIGGQTSGTVRAKMFVAKVIFWLERMSYYWSLVSSEIKIWEVEHLS
jgi:hypothetical protein